MGFTLGKESGDWLQRKAECEHIFRGRMEFYRQKSLELLEQSGKALRTKKVVLDPHKKEDRVIKEEEWLREQRANVRWLDLAVKIEERQAKFDLERGWTSRPADDELSNDERVAAAQRMIQEACFRGDPPTELEEVADARQALAEKVSLEKQAERLAAERNALGERAAAAERRVRELEMELRGARETAAAREAAAEDGDRPAESHSPATQGGRGLSVEHGDVTRTPPDSPATRGGRGRSAKLSREAERFTLAQRTPRTSPFAEWPYCEEAEPNRRDAALHWRYALPADFDPGKRHEEQLAKILENRRLNPGMPASFISRPAPLRVGKSTYIVPTRDEDLWSLPCNDRGKQAFVERWLAEKKRREEIGEPFPEPTWRPKFG